MQKTDTASLFLNFLREDQIDLINTTINKTTGTSVHNAASLYPESTDEIVKILEVCNTHKLSLMPISTGRNWGYTDGAPLNDGQITLNLSRMNKILHYNKDRNTITLEPGVTQGELCAFLKEQGDHHIASITGSKTNTSVVGNYLERGFGITPFCDHADAITDIKAILADGSIHSKTLNNFNCKEIAQTHNHDLGPNFTDLFVQSNFGIVTEMTFRLARSPEQSHLTVIEATAEQLPALFNDLTTLMSTWNVPGLTLKILNQTASVSSAKIPLTQDFENTDIAQIASENSIPPYIILLIHSGPKDLVHALRKAIKKTITAPRMKFSMVNQTLYKCAKLIKGFTPQKLKYKIEALSMLVDYTRGIPTDKNIALAYWGHQNAIKNNENDPAKDGCGLIWYAPIIPFSHEAYKTLESIIKEIFAKYQFHPAVNLTGYNAQNCIALAPILYDRQTQAEQAQACYNELLEAGLAAGFPPYRLPDFAMDCTNLPETHLAKKIKTLIDPNNVIAPNKYGI